MGPRPTGGGTSHWYVHRLVDAKRCRNVGEDPGLVEESDACDLFVALTGREQGYVRRTWKQVVLLPPFLQLLVGEYGTGKSELIARLTSFVADVERAVPFVPLPLSLRRCRASSGPPTDSWSSAKGFWSLITRALPDKKTLEHSLTEALREAIASGSVLLLLDGLDELATSIEDHRAFLIGLDHFIESLGPQAPCRIVLTMRQEYLNAVDTADYEEIRRALVRGDTARDIWLSRLALFSRGELRTYLARRFKDQSGPELFSKVEENASLSAILSRPLLVAIFCDLFQGHEVAAGAATDLAAIDSSASLFDIFTETAESASRERQLAYGSEHSWHKPLLAASVLRAYVEEFRIRVNLADARAALIPVCQDARPVESIPDSDVFRSFYKCPFLVNDEDRPSELLRFSHRAFHEFLVVWGMVAELRSNGVEHADGFNEIAVNADMRKFLVELRGEQQFFENDIMFSCGLAPAKSKATGRPFGWGLAETDFEAQEELLRRHLIVLTRGMTWPERQDEDLEDSVRWFLATEFDGYHPGYVRYTTWAVATFLHRHAWSYRDLAGDYSVKLEKRLRRLEREFENDHRDKVVENAAISRLRKEKELLLETLLKTGQYLRHAWFERLNAPPGDIANLVARVRSRRVKRRLETWLEGVRRLP